HREREARRQDWPDQGTHRDGDRGDRDVRAFPVFPQQAGFLRQDGEGLTGGTRPDRFQSARGSVAEAIPLPAVSARYRLEVFAFSDVDDVRCLGRRLELEVLLSACFVEAPGLEERVSPG